MSWIPLLSWRSWAGVRAAVVPVGPALRTLLDQRPRTEDRGADPQVCRTVTYGMFEVTAHPGRDPRRRRHLGAYVEGDRGQSREGLVGVTVERRDPHDTAQPEPLGLLDARHQRGHVVGRAPRPTLGSGRVETDLDEAVEVASALPRTAAQPGDQLGAVDGVHDVGVGRDGCCLVALQAADEVPAD